MALIYRAIWNEEREDLPTAVAGTVLRWLEGKGVGVTQMPALGEATGEYEHSRFGTKTKYKINVRRASSDGVAAYRTVIDEDQYEIGERWTTTLTVLEQPGEPGTIWIDVERHALDPFEDVPFHAPALAKILIEEGTEPRVGHIRLEPRPVVIPVEGLAGLIRNEERRLPMVVFSHDRAGPDETLARARAAYDCLAGVAAVFVLPENDVDRFREILGEELAVWGGAARLYLPNTGQRGLRPQRHRFVTGTQAGRSWGAAGAVFVNQLASSISAMPPPNSFEVVREALIVGGGTAESDDSEMLTLALEDNERLAEQVRRLQAGLEVANDAIDDLSIDVEALTDEVNQSKVQQARMLESLGRGASPTRADGTEPPETVDSIEEAVLEAMNLRMVEIHPSAPVDLDKLDATVNGPAWAKTMWRGFRALDAYASDDPENRRAGFWEWCRAGLSPWCWPATPKKLAMSESEHVRNSGSRILPVATAVSASGTVRMEAHLKIAEGGGPLAPRVYFYDDTSGPTRKVHVGFVGPHEHMPNKSTN